MLAVGFIGFLLGLGLAVWARVYLGRNWGMPMTQKQDPELVTTGPYRYIRHPIYSGMLLMTLGSALDVNAYWLLGFVVAAVFFIYSALAEERNMTKQFPKTYPTYKSQTKMLVPFIL
jgi:protein-S-isoprenylcysteine O-methyltransferase Ste14